MASLRVDEKKLNYRPRSPAIDRKRPHRNVEVCTMGAVEIIGNLIVCASRYISFIFLCYRNKVNRLLLETKNTQQNKNQRLGFIKSLPVQQCKYAYDP